MNGENFGMSAETRQELFHCDCMEYMKEMEPDSVDFVLTDIPYNEVSRDSNGLRSLDKGDADVLLFDLNSSLKECLRIAKGAVCIFCGREQFSTIFDFFAGQKGTVRPIVWKKTNPSPMNCQYVYLSDTEFAVWFKKRGYKTFNAFHKSTVFEFPCGRNEIHPTQKNIGLFKELIRDNTNENDLVFDPCAGSFTTGIACKEMNRNCIGVEINKAYYERALKRIRGQNDKGTPQGAASGSPRGENK